MILREAIQQFSGLRYMTEQLEICSAPGRRFLLESAWLNTKEEVEAQFDGVAEVLEKLRTAEGKALIETVACKLMQVRDIRGTINRTGQECVLDDLELYELKNFSLLSEEISKLVSGWKCVSVPELEGVVALLDPEGNRVPHFYIYDEYAPELAARRAVLKRRKQEGADEAETEAIFLEVVELEDEIRGRLTAEVAVFYNELQEALKQIARLDILVAKARQAEKLGLVRPVPDDTEADFRGLFNPQLQDILQKQGKQFQPVDLLLRQEATLITGANMVGKTVLLRTVALAQCLLQFGFYVPAAGARMVLVDEVLASIGDEQDELNGLSSFAAEMLRVDGMVKRIRAGRRILVLADELARTTNPAEGRAIVNGVLDFLNRHHTMALVTTHYGGVVTAGRRLRVKGFVEDKARGELTLANLGEWIDYSLVEDEGTEVPHEALRIAALLGVDRELLESIGTAVDR